MKKPAVHKYDHNKSFRYPKQRAGSLWVPAACGTRVVRGWFPHCVWPTETVDCKRCLKLPKEAKAA